MKDLIRWAIQNAPGMNVLMLAVLAIGAWSMTAMRREVFPDFELEIVMISVAYPGATPSDVESGVIEKIEEVVRSVEGVEKMTSIAKEGAGFVLLELQSDIKDVQKVLGEVDREVARITSFPDLAEDPEIEQITFRDTAIRLAVIGLKSSSPAAELRLRTVAERVRDELLKLPAVSSAEIAGAKPYQIDVELPESILRQHGLNLSQVAEKLRRENVELPGGQLKSEGQEVLLRANNRGRIGEEIARLPLISDPSGAVLTVGDIAQVSDEFEDISSISEINGLPALVINVQRTKSEDLLAMTEAVKEYAANVSLPAGYRMEVWGDSSIDVRDRMELLIENGVQGLILVFIILALFLHLRLAFWVALGIPISLLGAGIVLWYTGNTLNMLSLFAFLVVLGIVVDDAIVVGENVYAHYQMGKPLHQAAIDGTLEVFPSVSASVSTTILAFVPMFYVTGVMGKFMAVIPAAVIATLCFSLWESIFVLPCHLSHEHRGFFRFMGVLAYPLRPFGRLLEWLSEYTSTCLDWFVDRVYVPALNFCLRHTLVPIAILLGMMIVTLGAIRGGMVPLVPFPKLDSKLIVAKITFPDGTPVAVTDRATRRLEESVRELNREIGLEHAAKLQQKVEEIYPETGLDFRGPVELTFRQVGEITSAGGPAAEQGASGSHAGQVMVQLHDTTIREISSQELINRWRKKAGEFPGIESLTFGSVEVGPGGRPLEFKLLAPASNTDQLQAATELAKKTLGDFTGVFDVADDNTPGKWEFQFKIKDDAVATGVTPADLGENVRNAFFGAEVMRLQRGRHEVKLMARYPKDERHSLADLTNMQIRTPDGLQHPITELAEIKVLRGFSEINRVDQERSITITADVDETVNNATQIIANLRAKLVPELKQKYPQVSVLWEGQQQQTRDSISSLRIGFSFAMLAMFVLLVLQFQSYFQPLLILAAIPFGMIGAVWGHAVLGLPLTLFSMFGLVALAGVVVNDSIVLVDFINVRVRAGEPLKDALRECGRRRFRPVLLTSLTTIAGLAPLLLERSFQAQLLIPMATSLAFGLMASTLLVLFMVPLFYQIYVQANEFLFGPGAMVQHASASEQPESPSLLALESKS